MANITIAAKDVRRSLVSILLTILALFYLNMKNKFMLTPVNNLLNFVQFKPMCILNCVSAGFHFFICVIVIL